MTEESYLVARGKTVVKANELIQQSHFDLSLQQQKIILYLISQISPYDEEFQLYELPIREFCRICGLDMTSGKNYVDIKAAIKEIADKSVWISISEEEETLLRWIEKPYINKQDGVVKIKLDNDMRPYLLQLKENFTSYELIWTLHFKSKYTIRLYELIKSIHFHDLENYTRRYRVEDLKKRLNGEHYREYRDFKRRVLRPSVEEIDRYSDKTVTFQEIKQGKRVVAVEFTITSKDSLEAARIRSDIEKELGTDQMTLWDLLEERNLVDRVSGPEAV